MKYPVELVLQVNEIFHDIEGSDYYHIDIVLYESSRWKKFGSSYLLNKSKGLKIMDIGTGTGFVPSQIGNSLKENDLLICSDISTNILNVCKKNLSEKNYNCKLEFLKINGKKYDLESNSLDFITLNSVLHHIPNFSVFFEEINRLLKKNGRLVIGHEPNKLFSENKFLWYNFRILHLLLKPLELLVIILKRLKLYSIIKKIFRRNTSKVVNPDNFLLRVNKILIDKCIINKPLRIDEIIKIVDIHSPTAGDFNKKRGININQILNSYLPNFKIEYLETYDHLKKLSNKNKIMKFYNSILKRIFPKDGGTFFVILKKIC
jgi:ubiquinone/menaquinone biosynthesis C-methylase UbiE